MKNFNPPFVISFENGFTKTEIKRTLGELKQFNPDFSRYSNDIGESCHKQPFEIRVATKEEVLKEKYRLTDIEQEFRVGYERNRRIDAGNERVKNATDIEEFLNAYK